MLEDEMFILAGSPVLVEREDGFSLKFQFKYLGECEEDERFVDYDMTVTHTPYSFILDEDSTEPLPLLVPDAFLFSASCPNAFDVLTLRDVGEYYQLVSLIDAQLTRFLPKGNDLCLALQRMANDLTGGSVDTALDSSQYLTTSWRYDLLLDAAGGNYAAGAAFLFFEDFARMDVVVNGEAEIRSGCDHWYDRYFRQLNENTRETIKLIGHMPSSFHAWHAAFTYDLPRPVTNPIVLEILGAADTENEAESVFEYSDQELVRLFLSYPDVVQPGNMEISEMTSTIWIAAMERFFPSVVKKARKSNKYLDSSILKTPISMFDHLSAARLVGYPFHEILPDWVKKP